MTKTKVGRRGKHGYKSTRKRMSGGRWPWSSKPETSTPETPETPEQKSCKKELYNVNNKEQGAYGTYNGEIIRNKDGKCVAHGTGTWTSDNGKIIVENRDWIDGIIDTKKTVEKPKITGLENAMNEEGYDEDKKAQLRANEEKITGGKRKMRHRKSKNKTRTNKKRKHRRTSRR
jgi:hypothetical protein